MTRRWNDVLAIADAALELRDAERTRYLETACGGDAELRTEVEALLRQAERPDEFLDREPGGLLQAPADALPAGAELGVWRIVRLVTSGGMGTVYEGVRADGEFDMRVAIKVVKAGMDSAEILRRFENERQVLAGLDHPGIARLIDGGVTPEGRPFLVMEYVDGQPIDAYCGTNELSIEDRLLLFEKVCAAVHSAHQALVVHRDLKPSNVLVTTAGEPKLLDFGIAKVLAVEPGRDPHATIGHARPLTPEYASPEQVRGTRITTATDVHALGLLLFELLTGRRAFRFDGATWAEIERTVLEIAPPRPSDVAPEAVCRTLRGDLDTVIGMALQKDPARRYASARQLSEDVERFRHGMPVVARPDTALYRLRKFTARNRVLVLSACTVLVTLVVGLIVTLVQFERTASANVLAQRRGAEARTLARTYLRDLDRILVKIPGTTPAREFVVRTGLRYLDAVADQTGSDPALLLEVADGFVRIGDIQGGPLYANLGRGDDARASYRRSLDIASRLLASNPDVPGVRVVLARSHHRLGALDEIAGSLDRTSEQYRLAMEVMRGASPAEQGSYRMQRVMLEVADSRATLALQQRKFDEALVHAEDELAIARALPAQSPRSEALRVGLGLARRGEVLSFLARYAEAEADLREAIARVRAALEAEPGDAELSHRLAFSLSTLVNVLQFAHRLDECVDASEELVDLNRRRAQIDPRDQRAQRNLLVGLMKLGDTLRHLREHDRLRGVVEEQVSLARRLSEAAPDSAEARRDLVIALVTATRATVTAGRPADALPLVTDAARTAEALVALRPDDSRALETRAGVDWDLGKVRFALGEREPDPQQQLEHWRRARVAFQRGIETFTELDERGRLSPALRSYLDAWAEDVRRCDDRITRARDG